MTSFVCMVVLVGLIVVGWFGAKGWLDGARVSGWWLAVLWICFCGVVVKGGSCFVVGLLWLRAI